MVANGLHSAFRYHGGNLSAARTAFPSAPLPWIDLSTGVNPYPWPAEYIGDSTALPDPSEVTELEKVAASYFCSNEISIAALPGADIGLRLLPRLLSARSVAMVGATYQGHAEAWRAAGKDVRIVDRSLMDQCDADAIIIVNPNNPDGMATEPHVLQALLARQSARGRWLIVDESFTDVAPELSFVEAARPGLVILRSFGKFFGLPGVRLGFVIGDPAVVETIRSVTGAWPVSVNAVQVGRAAYANPQWHARTRRQLAAAAQELDVILTKSGFSVVGGTSLFRLVAHQDAERLFGNLAETGILVRPFAYEPTWLRFGIPRAEHWKRVTHALEKCI